MVVLPIYDLVGHSAPRVRGYDLMDFVLYLRFFLAGYLRYRSETPIGFLIEVGAEDPVALTVGTGLLLSAIVKRHLTPRSRPRLALLPGGVDHRLAARSALQTLATFSASGYARSRLRRIPSNCCITSSCSSSRCWYGDSQSPADPGAST